MPKFEVCDKCGKEVLETIPSPDGRSKVCHGCWRFLMGITSVDPAAKPSSISKSTNQVNQYFLGLC